VYRVTTVREFVSTLDQFFGGDMGDSGSIGDLLSDMGEDIDEESGAAGDDVSMAADNELVKLVNKIIVDAYHQGASDIHIEPYPGKGKTEGRFRKGRDPGAVHFRPGKLPQAIAGASENHVRPRHLREAQAAGRQDQVPQIRTARHRAARCDDPISRWSRRHRDAYPGRGRADPAGQARRVGAQPQASQGDRLQAIRSVLRVRADRLGKTTTLHSGARDISIPTDTKIWTAEDPVEITQKGLRQVQMNPKAGLNFATAMRAFLRAEPDIIMVGEMRDKETTAIGIEASLTGSLGICHIAHQQCA
jgi:hypothetical protein